MPTNVSEMNLEDMILAYLRDKQGLLTANCRLRFRKRMANAILA